MSFSWTPPMDRTLKSMSAMGCSYAQIGVALKVSTDAARQRMSRIRRGVLSKEQYKERLVASQRDGADTAPLAPNDDALHLRLIAEAMRRGEHLPNRRAA